MHSETATGNHWFLDDPTEVAANNPYTFYLPSPEILSKVKVGDAVKLIFRGQADDPQSPRAERMWVLVDVVHPDGRFEGRLDNDPYYLKGVTAGDPVAFESKHIICTEYDDPTDVTRKYSARAYVTNRILNDSEPIRVLFREPPDDGDDSGWRFLAGDETEAYMQDPANIEYVSLGDVLSRDDSVVTLLDAAVGSAFRRDPASGLFAAERPAGGSA